jgi:hypothetical protein
MTIKGVQVEFVCSVMDVVSLISEFGAAMICIDLFPAAQCGGHELGKVSRQIHVGCARDGDWWASRASGRSRARPNHNWSRGEL